MVEEGVVSMLTFRLRGNDDSTGLACQVLASIMRRHGPAIAQFVKSDGVSLTMKLLRSPRFVDKALDVLSSCARSHCVAVESFAMGFIPIVLGLLEKASNDTIGRVCATLYFMISDGSPSIARELVEWGVADVLIARLEETSDDSMTILIATTLCELSVGGMAWRRTLVDRNIHERLSQLKAKTNNTGVKFMILSALATLSVSDCDVKNRLVNETDAINYAIKMATSPATNSCRGIVDAAARCLWNLSSCSAEVCKTIRTSNVLEHLRASKAARRETLAYCRCLARRVSST